MSRLEKNKTSFKSVLDNSKASFQRVKWKEAFTFFGFLLLAAGFWLMQNLQQEYEVEMTIPIKYRNIPPEVAFTSTPPEHVTIRVKDKGSVLLNYALWGSFMPLDVNLKELPLNKTRFIPADRKKIESDIQKQLIASTSLTYTEPTSIDLSYGKLKEKEIPVSFNGLIETRSGFQIVGDIDISPSKVMMFANQATIDSVKVIQTEFKQISRLDKSISISVKLQKPEGASLDPEMIILTVPVEEFTEKTLVVPILCSDLPGVYELKTFPSSVNVSCNVSTLRFKELEAFAFEIDVPFDSLKDNRTGTVKLQLTKQPDWIYDPVITPNTIEFILEQKSTTKPEDNPQKQTVEE